MFRVIILDSFGRPAGTIAILKDFSLALEIARAQVNTAIINDAGSVLYENIDLPF